MSSAKRVLLLGSTGQLGFELTERFRKADLLALDRRSADLSQPESLRDVVRSFRPEIILNAAAYTAVDRAESEPDLADRVNHRAVRVLAEEAERLRALLVHYSTDYVFDGSKSEAWVETDTPAPLNVYGATKLAGEQAITATCPRHIILRTSWVYSARGHNFLLTMLRLGRERDVLRVVNDQWGAPTSAAALAEATREMIDRLTGEDTENPETWAGVYHATCGGQTSWCGFAKAVFAEAIGCEPRKWPQVEGIASENYPTPARRPRNSVLLNRRLKERFSIELPKWEVALHTAVKELFRSYAVRSLD